jgi:uncharacterized repeat protein (TIGR01451 family)/LPXTG-motif cell wall-anchored protein
MALLTGHGIGSSSVRRCLFLLFGAAGLSVATDTVSAAEFPTGVSSDIVFQKTFDPVFVDKGGTSTLGFVILNEGEENVTGLAFDDVLPSAITVASTPALLNTCGGTVDAAPLSGSITLTGGSLAGGGVCVIEVDVTSSTAGSHLNVTNNINWDGGSGGVATDELNVSPDPLALTKAFGPDTIEPGDVTSLMLEIANSDIVGALAVAFTDNLPADVVVASPPSAVNGCGGTLTAVEGAATIRLSGGEVAAQSTCQISVAVTSSTIGNHLNEIPFVTSTFGDGPGASAVLNVVEELPAQEADLSISKDDAPDPVSPGSNLTYTLEVSNAGPSTAAGVVVTDILPAGSTLVSTSGCAGDPNGVPDCALGDLAPGDTATYTIIVTVDSSAAGALTNTATVSAATADPDTTDNSASTTTELAGPDTTDNTTSTSSTSSTSSTTEPTDGGTGPVSPPVDPPVLPSTGAESPWIALVGVATVLVGAVLLGLVGRRRSPS